MFKTLLKITILMILAYPIWSSPEHHHNDHVQSEPELVITPIVPDELKPGVVNKVALFIQDKHAKPVDVSQFEVVHTQPVHLLIIEPGLHDYHHEHPIQRATGQYVFNFTPQTACSYRVWVDVQLKGSYQHYFPVDLKGTEACEGLIDKTINLQASSQGYDFTLTLENTLKAGEAAFAHMDISKDEKPVDGLEPIMGTFAHMVGFYEDYESIAHIHPIDIESTECTNADDAILRFHIEPKQTGYLKLFTQVKIHGQEIVVPFRILIAE